MTLAPPPPPKDPIELEQLPANAQEKVRAAWRNEQRLAEVQEQRVCERRTRMLLEGVFILLGVELIVYGLNWRDLVLIPLVGIAVGTVWHRWQTEREMSAVVGLLGFGVVRLVCGPGKVLAALLAAFLVVNLCLVIAHPRTAERLGA